MVALGVPNTGALAPCIGRMPPQLTHALVVKVRTRVSGQFWEEIPLPERLNAIILVNIRSHGAGRKMWEPLKAGWRRSRLAGGYKPQAMADGFIEVGGIASPIHLGLYLGCGFGYLRPCAGMKLAQACALRIELLAPLAVQADGEPWIQPPGTIAIDHAGVATMLRAPSRQEWRKAPRWEP